MGRTAALLIVVMVLVMACAMDKFGAAGTAVFGN